MTLCDILTKTLHIIEKTFSKKRLDYCRSGKLLLQ